MLYNDGIEGQDTWTEVSRFFMKEKHKSQHMTLKKFYTDNKLGLLIDLRSMANQEMHGSSTRIVNTTDSIQLEINCETPREQGLFTAMPLSSLTLSLTSKADS